jgi:hypothetical protein
MKKKIHLRALGAKTLRIVHDVSWTPNIFSQLIAPCNQNNYTIYIFYNGSVPQVFKIYQYFMIIILAEIFAFEGTIVFQTLYDTFHQIANYFFPEIY